MVKKINLYNHGICSEDHWQYRENIDKAIKVGINKKKEFKEQRVEGIYNTTDGMIGNSRK